MLSEVYTIEIKPREPYSLKYTSMCYATPWDYDGKRTYIPMIIENNKVCSVLEEKEHKIHLRIYSEKPDDDIIEKSILSTKHVMALEEDLSEYYSIIRNDPLLHIVYDKLYGIHMRAVSSLWEAAIIGICQQNASFRQGWRMVLNIRKIMGEVIHIKEHNVVLHAFPSPQKVLRAYNKLDLARVGYRKSIILETAKRFSRGELDDLENIRGVGQYTARIARIIGKRKYDEFPVDRWFARLIPFVYGGKEESWSVKQVELFAKKKWGKWCGLSAIMITIITAAETYSRTMRNIKVGILDPFPDRPAPMTLWKYNI